MALAFLLMMGLAALGGARLGSDGEAAAPARRPTDIIYPGAGRVSRANGPVAGMASVSYIVREEHPTVILEFYDRELAKLGYVRRVDPVLGGDTRKWVEFIDATSPPSPKVRQLGGFWVQPVGGRHVRLVLREYEFKDSVGSYRVASGQEVVVQEYGAMAP